MSPHDTTIMDQPTAAPISPFLAALRAKRDAAKVTAEAEVLSADDKEEAALRAEIAAHEETAKTKQREARQLDLARREDAARETLGPTIPIATMDGEADGNVHTFVVRYAGAQAFNVWEKGIQMAVTGQKDPATGKKVDRAANARKFALASVWDWNGKIIASDKDAHATLSALLEGFPGLASMICNAAAKLSGYALEEQKSTG